MSEIAPRNPNYAAEVRRLFAAQRFLSFLGAELLAVAPGQVEIGLALRPELTQQQDFWHGGVVATLADVGGGFAALSLMPPAHDVLTVEFKLNFLRPGVGARALVRSGVLRSGRTLTVGESRVFAVSESGETLMATALGTFMALERR